MKSRSALVLTILFLQLSQAQNSNQVPGLNIALPEFEAHLGFGFNYDLLRSPLAVSFDQATGFFGCNVPIEQTFNLRGLTKYMDPAIDNMFGDTTLIRNGSDFKPRAGARQNPNITLRVEVPMLGGVASFSSIQNFFLNYQTLLGNPNIFMSQDSQGVSFLLRGTVNVPLNLSMSWETMTFAYAYKFSDLFSMGFALHRHVFSVDLRGKVDVDLLGRYRIDLAQGQGVDIKPIEGEIDYPSERVHGVIDGYYNATAWSPTLALRCGRLSVVARFGIATRARGALTAAYSLPFFVDPETFKTSLDFNDPDVRIGLQTNEVDSVTYTTARTQGSTVQRSDLEWRMPTGLTADVEIVRGHFSLSYTKLFGEIGMRLDRIVKVRSSVAGDSVRASESDSTVLDLGFLVDHVMLARIALKNAYVNLGVFGMDLRYAGRMHILGNAMLRQLRLGRMAMLPVLNFGGVLGTRWQLIGELDLLPLPALRSGVVFYF
jgi:hypothetical protein